MDASPSVFTLSITVSSFTLSMFTVINQKAVCIERWHNSIPFRCLGIPRGDSILKMFTDDRSWRSLSPCLIQVLRNFNGFLR